MPDPSLTVESRLAEALAGRYRIERQIGRGGMATVYLADDLKHDRQVAIKLLYPELSAWLGAERFLSEIRITARLQHPHILPLLDSGSVPGGHIDQGEGPSFLFYVMPFVVGETLRARLERERQLSVAEAVRIAKEIAGALAYAHSQGVIHRDIKPENILLGPPDAAGQRPALVSDFGVARSLDATGDRLTGSGMTVGTAAYMSPEQATAEREIDGRSDIYSLGCVLYEMFAGEPPFTGPNPRVILSKQLTDPVRPVSRVRDGVPPHVDAALATALGRSPADRFPDAASFAAALDASRPLELSGATASRSGAWATASPRTMSRLAVAGGAVVLTIVAAWTALSRPRVVDAMPSVRIQRFTATDTPSAYLAATLQQDVAAALADSRSVRVFTTDSARLTSGFAVTGAATRVGDSVEIRLIVAREPMGEFVNRRNVRHAASRIHELPMLAANAILDLVDVPRHAAVPAARRPATRDSLAYDYFLRGRYQADQRTEQAIQRAVSLFRRAVERDSMFADGWAGLARVLEQAILRRYDVPGVPPDSLMSRVLDASQRALDADSTRSYVWLARGMTLRSLEPTSRRDMIAALAKAIALDSVNADAWHYRALAWADSLVPDSALHAWRRAVQIDPTHRQALGFLPVHFMWARNYDSALVWADSGKRIDPTNLLIRQSAGQIRFLRGDLNDAAADYLASIPIANGPDALYGWVGLAAIAVQQGNKAAADTLLPRALALADTLRPALHDAAYLAWGYTALGQHDRALRLLQRFEPRADKHYQLHLRHDPVLDSLRSMPAFNQLLIRR